MPKILIASPNSEWLQGTKDFFEQNKYQSDLSGNGKETQLNIFKNKYVGAVIDLELSNNSSLEVVRYIQNNHPSLKIVLCIFNTQLLEKMEMNEADLKKLGASSVLIQPDHESIFSAIQGSSLFSQWKNITPTNETPSEETEVTAGDDEFTSIKLVDFLSGNTAIFDLFIKLGSGRYLKILNRGDFFEPERIKKYRDEKKVEYLFFKKTDRITYVNFMNDLLSRMSKAQNFDPNVKIKAAKNVVEKYVEEIYTEGINPVLLEEGAHICENVYNMVKNDPNLWKALRSLIDYDESFQSHLFMVTLFSSVTCKNLEWSSPSTVDKIAFASMVHDIGKIKLPPELITKSRDQMTPEELVEYKMHPGYGSDLLKQYPTISPQVIQIVEQHHEWVNGTGFPRGLSGIKIFPLAKVVSLANDVAEHLVKSRLTPIEGLKHFIRDREVYVRYDGEILKAFVKGFSDPDKLKD